MSTPLNFAKLFASVALIVVFHCALPANAADVEPLRSANLESRLLAAGFDDAQRARVLAEYEAYVARFKQVADTEIVAWQSIGGTRPKSMEDAQALQRKGRVAAQAIDDAERPLLDAIRLVARPDQAIVVGRLLSELEIRRDLTFSATLREGFFVQNNVDLLRAIEGAHFPPATILTIQPQLDQYLVERQAAVRKIRDATINIPVRRFEAREKNPMPAMPQPAGDSPMLSDEFREYFQAQSVVTEAITVAANAERNSARSKLVELDARSIESILPAIGGRDQTHLLSLWWAGAGVMGHGKGGGAGGAPSELRRAWEAKEDKLNEGVASQLDGICLAWVGQWWPCAKTAAIAATSDGGAFMFHFGRSGDEKSSGGCAERVEAETVRTVEAIRFALDGAEVPVAIAQADGTFPNGNSGQTAFSSATAVTTMVVSGESTGGFMLTLGDMGGVEINGEMIEFDGDMLGGISFEISGDGPDGMKGPRHLPRLVKFEQIEPVLVAAGVEPDMLTVAKTLIDDLQSEAATIVEEAATLEPGSPGRPEMIDDMFEVSADGVVSAIDPAKRAKLVRDRNELRTRLLALEAATLNDMLSTIVPAEGLSTCAWLIPWRQLESSRSAKRGGGPMGMLGGTKIDPIQAVFAARFDPADWTATANELSNICTDLASRTQACNVAMNRSIDAMPMPTFADSGDAMAVTPTETDGKQMDEFMKLQNAADQLAKALKRATEDSILTIKARLGTESAQRLQDTYDDQMYSRDLKDPTDLSAQFSWANSMDMPEAARAQVVAMRAQWTVASRDFRNKIVAICSRSTEADAPNPDEVRRVMAASRTKKVELAAVKFERDELNRRIYRELASIIGPEFAVRLQPLPGATAGSGVGRSISGSSFSIQGGSPNSTEAPPPPPPSSP